MKYIRLNNDKQARVDDDLYEWLNQWKWYAKKNYTTGKYYAARTLNGTTRNSTVYLHQLLLSPPAGYEIDHVDHDTLNNQRSNLRLATKAQNQWNRHQQKNNTTGWKGIYFHKRDQHFRVQIRRLGGGRRITRGFKTIEEAVAFRDKMYKKYHGEFAGYDVIINSD